MQVKASPGLQCPKEGKPREYISDAEAVEVSDGSVYYQKLIADGSLVEVDVGARHALPLLKDKKTLNREGAKDAKETKGK